MTKWSQLGHKTYKEVPSDAEVPSHQLLLRAGLVKKVAPGIFDYGPIFLRAVRKFESIIRDEHDSVGCQELLLPMVHPRDLWDESKRWDYPELLKFKNRNDHDFCLGATHEEVITDFVRNDINSYKELPVVFYQIQTKFRDEIRPRFGLMRGREFIMKDAYSFDVSTEAAQESYYKLREVYVRIFDRLGLSYRIVKADAGAMGGSLTEEFQVLADIGEDQLLFSDESGFAANLEICPRLKLPCEFDEVKTSSKLEEFDTPNLRSIEDLSRFTGLPEAALVKTMFFSGSLEDKEFDFAVLLRGSDQVNPIKLKNTLGLIEEPRLLIDKEVRSLTSADPGSCGPVGLSIEVFADHSLEEYQSMIVGANKDDFHLRGVKPGRDFKVSKFFDLTLATEGDPSPDSQGKLKSIRGIEVGHIFYLGTKYSEAMKAHFLDKNGKSKPFEMGCYGIGVGRTVQAAIEQSHDEDGIVWPRALAPYDVHICLLDENEEIEKFLAKTVEEVESHGLSVFVDNRKERPGVKFKDADLLGFPLRLTLGKRGFDQGVVDIMIRETKEKLDLKLEEVSSKIIAFFKESRS